MSGGNGSLPKGWVQTTLGELGEYHNGRAFKKEEWSETGRPIIRIQNLTDPSKPYNRFQGEAEARHEIRRGDLLVSWAATLGVFRWAGPAAVLNQHIFKVESNIDPRFHYYILKHALGALYAQSHGSGMVHVTRGRFDATPVSLPPLAEQKHIVAVIEATLSQVEAGLSSFARAARLTALYERAALQHALGNCVAPTDRGQGSDTLPELPGTWEWSAVAKEGTVQLGRMLNKERSSGSHMRPYLRVANVLDDRLDLSDVKEMDFPPGEYERYLLHPGDILLNEGQSPELLGRAAMYRGERPGLCFQKTLLRFRAGPRVDPEFALLVFRHYLYAGRFRRESRITTGIGHLTQVRFAAMEFPVPPLAEQYEIVRDVRQQLDSAHRFGEVIFRAQQDADTFKASLLSEAFSGGLSRGESDRPPADALLSAIQERPAPRVPRGRNMRHAVPVGE